MPTPTGDRSAHFPAIEKKYGQPISHWLDLMQEIADRKYPEQIAYLRENHGFSQAHANAVVLYAKGNITSKRFGSFEEYIAGYSPEVQAGMTAIRKALESINPKFEIVMAWNQPMFKLNDEYIIGYSASKNHITIGPWLTDFIAKYKDRLTDYKHGTKTFQVSPDWTPDKKLLKDIVNDRIAELKS